MLHGGLGDISNFEKVIPNLSKKFRVIIPDAPGLGRSEYADSLLSYQLLADYNSKLIDQLKLDSLYVIGWSDGTNTALILAKNRPEKVKKLIISGANYKLNGFTKEGLEECKMFADTTFVKNELNHWIKYGRQKIFFITDGHSAHKTKKLKAWLQKNKKRIEVFFLPPYSPELNAQEYVNQDIKTNVIGKKRPINKEQMRKDVEEFMHKRKKNKKPVQKYFHQKHVKYTA